jgi:hypothetical protein
MCRKKVATTHHIGRALLAIFALCGACTSAWADVATNPAVVQLSQLVMEARTGAGCAIARSPDRRLAQAADICDFLSLFDRRKSDSPREEGPRVETANRAIQVLEAYLQTTAAAEEIKARARTLEEQLSNGQLPVLPGLTLVPQDLCTQMGKDTSYCSVPGCLLGNNGVEPTARCPLCPLPFTETQLSDAVKKWHTAKGDLGSCGDPTATGICLPTDPNAIVVRDYLVSIGRAPILAALQDVEQTGDALVIGRRITNDLQCWVDRHAALTIAEAAQDALSTSTELAAQLAAATQAITSPGKDAQRTQSAQCSPTAVNTLYEAIVAALKSSLASTANARLAAASAISTLPARRPTGQCGAGPDSPEELFNFPQASSGFVKELRLRPSSNRDGRTDAILVLSDKSSNPKDNSTQCSPDEYEVNLGLSMDLDWDQGLPKLKGRFGQISFGTDADRLSLAISRILPIKGLYVKATARPASGIVPIAVDTDVAIPGISTTVALATFEIRPDRPQYGLQALLVPSTFRAALNDALKRQFPGPVAVSGVGVTIHALQLVDTEGDQSAANFSAIATVPALQEFGGEIPIGLYIGPSADPRTTALVLRPTALPSSVIEGIATTVRNRINGFLAALPKGESIGQFDALQLTRVQLLRLKRSELRLCSPFPMQRSQHKRFL